MRYYFIMMLMFGFSFASLAQPPETKLAASNGHSGDQLGTSVDISGNYAISGAPEDEPNGAKSGSVYFYELVNGTWVEKQNMIPTDGSADDEYGCSVTIDGDWAAVGARYRGPSPTATYGKVYIYNRNTSGVWSEFTSFTLTSLDHFGTSVSMDNGYLAVGGVNAIVDYSGTLVQCGTVAIYRYNGSIWAKQTEVVPSDGLAYDEFGRSVSIQGDRLAIGAWKVDVSGNLNAGAVYMFSRIGSVWTQDVKLTAFDAATNDEYGRNVALFDDKIVVGSWKDDGKKGAVYFYKETSGTWGLSNKVTAFDGATLDYFGSNVDFIKANHVVVGAEKHKITGSRCGAAYLYEFDSATSTWISNTITNKIVATDGASSDFYGAGVAGDGDNILVGAYRDDDDGSSTGSNYFYDVSASVLPVEFVSFDATLQDNGHVLLDWVTATENNNEGFMVQRSQDGVDWEDIGWVDGVGFSAIDQSYSFKDKLPYEGVNYYRLNQLDFDGKQAYSELESVFIESEITFKLFPNPTSDYIHLSHEYNIEDINLIQLFDVTGRNVRNFSDADAPLDVTDIEPGQYYLVLGIKEKIVSKSVQIW